SVSCHEPTVRTRCARASPCTWYRGELRRLAAWGGFASDLVPRFLACAYRRGSCRSFRRSVGGCRGDLGEPAAPATGWLGSRAPGNGPTRAALLVSVRRRRGGCRKARARSAAALAAGFRGLPSPLSTRYGSQRVHHAHEPV